MLILQHHKVLKHYLIMKRISLSCLFTLLSFTFIFAQLPYYEDFSTTDGEGVVGASGGIGNPITPFNACNSQWSIVGNGTGLTAATDYLQVSGGVLEGQDLDSELCFRTSSIDVSAITSLDFDLLATEVGVHETTDYVEVSYIIDGTPTVAQTLIDDFNSVTVSLDNIDVSAASTFQLEVCMLNNASVEQLQIDNIAIYESGTAAPTSGTPICPSDTEVQFASTTSSITEDGATIDVCVGIINEDAVNPTTVEVSLDLASTATEGAANDFTASPALTATLTFPAGSSTPQCVTFTINDDADVEGNEDIVLNLSNPMGGSSATLGTNTLHTLTITDNDAAGCTYATGGIYISELSYNPCGAQGPDGNCEYVEIFNAYSNTVDLSDWSLTGFEYTFPASTTIASGAYLVIARSNSNCVDYDLAGLPVSPGALTNSGETLTIVDNCGNTTYSVTYNNTFANGDCNAVNIAPDGTFSGVAPSPGTGSCAASADAYAPSCGITALGASSITCLNYTTNPDAVIVSIPYTGVDICATVTNNGSGVIGGDDLTTVTDGIIEITLNEGETWDIEITGSGCSGLTSTGTVSGTECTATCGVNASASTGTVDISSTTSSATVNDLDDAYISALETASCSGDELDIVYGGMTWDNVAGQGTIENLVITDGTNTGIPYAGIATFEIREVPLSCIGTGNEGIAIDGTSANNIISTSQSSMQGNSPKPSLIGGHFTETDGGFQNPNMICMNFTVPIDDITFWLGDVETSDVNPAYVHVYDAAGDVIISQPISTETPLGDQATNCVGSSSGSGFTGCGNNETAFVNVSSPTAVISQICIEVGDFSDAASNPGGTEHLSIGGVSLGGVCINRDPLPVCTDLLAYQDFDGSINTWQYTAFPDFYSEDTDSDIWQARLNPTGGTGSVSPIGAGNNYFVGIRDINNSGSGGSFEHTLTFEYDISCYENVSVNFDYTANGFDSGDYLAYEIQDEGGASIVAKTEVANNTNPTVAWTQSVNAIPNTVSAITLILYANQNGDADSGGFDRIYLCGTEVAAAPLTVTLDGSCGDNTGTIMMDLSGGNAPYEVSGDFASSISTSGTGIMIASDLPEDTYSVTVEDNCGNVSSMTVTVDAPCALPVEMLYFDARNMNGDAMLSWATAFEENNDYFAVEHSIDGNNFREIGKVTGAGNSTEQQSYQFLHEETMEGLNYYRLKQVDFDGSFEYSEVKVLTFGKVKDNNIISIRPTVGKSLVTLITSQTFSSNANVLVFNTTGKLVKEYILPAGETSLRINIEDLSAGHYFVKVVDNELSYSTRFIRQ